MVILRADVFHSAAQNMSFGMPVASTLAPAGSIERSRGTWEHERMETLGARLGFLTILGGFRDGIFGVFG